MSAMRMNMTETDWMAALEIFSGCRLRRRGRAERRNSACSCLTWTSQSAGGESGSAPQAAGQ